MLLVYFGILNFSLHVATIPSDPLAKLDDSLTVTATNGFAAYDLFEPICWTIFSRTPPLTSHQCDGLLSYFSQTEREHELLDFEPSHGPYRFSTTSEEEGGPCFVTVYAQNDAKTDHFTYAHLASFVLQIMKTCRRRYTRSSRGGWVRMASGHQQPWRGFSLRVDAYSPSLPSLASPSALDHNVSSMAFTSSSSVAALNNSIRPLLVRSLDATTASDPALPTPSCFPTAFSHMPELLPHQCDRLFHSLESEESRHIHVSLDDSHRGYTFNVDNPMSTRQCTITIRPVFRGATDDFTYKDVAGFAKKIYNHCKRGFWGLSRGGEIPMRFVEQRQRAGFQLRLSGERPPPSVNTSR